jgi:hypothetical protein
MVDCVFYIVLKPLVVGVGSVTYVMMWSMCLLNLLVNFVHKS